MLTKLYCNLISAKTVFMNKMREEKGSHIVEVVIFIAIAVGLVLLFKDKIADLIEKIFGTVDPKALSSKPTSTGP